MVKKLGWVVLAACSAPAARPMVSNERPAAPSTRVKFASFWKGRTPPSATMAECSDEQLRAAIDHKGTPMQRAEAFATLGATCSIERAALDLLSLDAIETFAGNLLLAGYPNDCEAELVSIITPYADGLHVEAPDPRVDKVAEMGELGDKCAKAQEDARKAFLKAACPGASCFELAGESRDCRTVSHASHTLVATDGPLADSEFCCNLEDVAVATLEGHTYLRVSGQGRVCGGGTASRTLDGVYRVDGDKLVLEVDDSISWH